jgi:hypothetical protein
MNADERRSGERARKRRSQARFDGQALRNRASGKPFVWLDSAAFHDGSHGAEGKNAASVIWNDHLFASEVLRHF